MTTTTRTWLEAWTAQWRANAEEAERNSLMDSGWSASTAARCEARGNMLLRDIIVLLATVRVEPADLFDRPQLVELIEAAKVATGKSK